MITPLCNRIILSCILLSAFSLVGMTTDADVTDEKVNRVIHVDFFDLAQKQMSIMTQSQMLTVVLGKAIMDDSREAFDQLLPQCDDLNYIEPRTGKGPVHWAAQYGRTSMLGRLLHRGASPNTMGVRSEFQAPPLFLAAFYGEMSAIKLLLHYKADLATSISSGDTAFHISLLRKHYDVAHYLMNHQQMTPELMNVANDKGETPCLIAVNHGRRTLVEDCMKKGARVYTIARNGSPVWIEDNNGKTVLMHAAGCPEPRMVDTILSAVRHLGKDLVKEYVNIFANNDTVAIGFAARQGNKKSVESLIAAKAMLDVIDSGGRSPLGSAARKRHVAIVDTLLNAKAYPFSETLVLAVQVPNNSAVIDRLLKAEILIELEAIEFAKKSQSADCVERLVQAKFGDEIPSVPEPAPETKETKTKKKKNKKKKVAAQLS